MEEIWKDIVGYEGHYKVSNNGKIKSIKFNKEKLLKCNKQKDGYVKIILLKDGKSKSFMVHRVVAKAFIENPYNLPKVNHKDENKQNNEVSNLEWCTQKYNINYGIGKIKMQTVEKYLFCK